MTAASSPPALRLLLDLLGGPRAAAAPTPQQIEAVAGLAVAHRLPRKSLERWAQRHSAGEWPRPPRALVLAADAAATRSLTATDWLLRLGRALDAAQIAYFVLKGPALATILYGDPARRAFRDLDLLVAPADFEPAVAVAAEMGWVPPPNWRRVRRIAGKFDLQLLPGLPLQPVLELGSAPFGSHFGNPRPNQARMVAIGGQPVPTLPPAELIAYVAMHGAKHLWFRLIWLSDFADLVDREGVPRGELLEVSRRWGAERAVTAAFMLAGSHLGLATSAGTGGEALVGAARLAAWATERIAGGPDAPETFRLHVRERLVGDRPLAAGLRSALAFLRPAEADIETLGADRPAWLHFLLRPLFWSARRLRSARAGR